MSTAREKHRGAWSLTPLPGPYHLGLTLPPRSDPTAYDSTSLQEDVYGVPGTGPILGNRPRRAHPGYAPNPDARTIWRAPTFFVSARQLVRRPSASRGGPVRPEGRSHPRPGAPTGERWALFPPLPRAGRASGPDTLDHFRGISVHPSIGPGATLART